MVVSMSFEKACSTVITDTGRYAEYAAARAEVFPNQVPASSTVTVADLVLPGMLVEVEAIAVLGSGS